MAVMVVVGGLIVFRVCVEVTAEYHKISIGIVHPAYKFLNIFSIRTLYKLISVSTVTREDSIGTYVYLTH